MQANPEFILVVAEHVGFSIEKKRLGAKVAPLLGGKRQHYRFETLVFVNGHPQRMPEIGISVKVGCRTDFGGYPQTTGYDPVQPENPQLPVIELIAQHVPAVAVFFEEVRHHAVRLFGIRVKTLVAKRDDPPFLNRAQEVVAETQFKALRPQVNPHFINNALSSIGTYVLREEPLKADRYLSQFAELMRRVLESSDRPTVTLAYELETLNLYLQLEALCNPFSYRIAVDETIDPHQTRTLPLLLQPLLENSVKHGFAHQSGDGHLQVRIRREGEALHYTVEERGRPEPFGAA